MNSDTLASQQQPFSCRGSHEQCYGGNGEKEGEGGDDGEGWRAKRKVVERFIPYLFPRCVSLPRSLVPPLLNLTLKQRCKNRMFLAEAQQ